MSLTQRERDIVELLRAEPLLDAAAIAERVGSTKAAASVHLSNLTKKGVILGRGYVVRPDTHSVVVVGGANMDIRAHSSSRAQLRTSNPGAAITTPGGVGRNIAENLARLGSPTHLVAPVGRDAFGDQLVATTRAAGVNVDHLIPAEGPTGTYLAVMDSTGELVVAVSNMVVTDQLTVRQLESSRELFAHADLLVLDGNLPTAPALWLLDLAAAHGVQVVLDPVSVAKASHLAVSLSPARPLAALTPNHDELESLVGEPVPNTRAGISRAARRLHALGVRHVWVRRGVRGSLLSSVADDGTVTVTALAAPAVQVADVTGAGDAMTAAFVHALLRGDAPADAARFGQMAAALTVASPETVRPDLTAQLVDAELHRPSPRPTKENR
ncbi:carbohydrate kinase [Nostocoides sp. HKS02]|uniref:carbohydrate kinase n=1 Tax=Nostocoides sp. HKS02 TaxID=1813880 RepID=UPI0012B4EEBA|nr:carbohydrate kinase [Tetrasphaera sp. HKS02]QGN59158.1 winged helix-turn-helix transcriptional regulator [Tetrasphaera sp. HKS02]